MTISCATKALYLLLSTILLLSEDGLIAVDAFAGMNNPKRSSMKGVPVVLGPYRSLDPIRVPAPDKLTTDDANVKRMADEMMQTHKLVPVVDFVTRGGVQWGDVAVCDWTATYVGGGVDGNGWTIGSMMKGCAKNSHEIEVTKEQNEPYKTFAENILGSGQMQTSTFVATWPEDHPSERLQSVKCRFSVVVKKIMKKVQKDTPPPSDYSQALDEALKKVQAEVDRKHQEFVDEQIRNAVVSVCQLDTDDVVNSVSWAKFGEKSLAAFSWNIIKEQIAAEEGIEPRDVQAKLREICKVEYI